MPASTTVRKAFGDLTNVAPSPSLSRKGGHVAKRPTVAKKPSSSLARHKQTIIKHLSESPRPSKPSLPRPSLAKPSHPTLTTRPEVGQTYTRLLPEGVEDIDAKDKDAQACSEYAVHIYSHLRQLEGRYKLPKDFLAGCPVNARMRMVLADWLVEAHQQFKMVPETLYLTLCIVDRFMAAQGRFIFKKQLQLVGVAAMFIAAKIEEIYTPDVADFVYVTDDTYTGVEVRHMELKILAALNWDFSSPLSLNFLRRFSKAGDVELVQHSLAKYILELALLDYSLLSLPGSQQAAASLHLSLQLLKPSEQVWSPTLQHYSGYTATQLAPTVSALASMLAKAPTAKLQAVRTKYKDAKFHRVACLPQLEENLSDL